jgi:GNAT superfamily N-acetyltransferase
LQLEGRRDKVLTERVPFSLMRGVGTSMEFHIRPARAGDGQAIYDVTRLSVQGLARDFYSAETIAGWMGRRDAAFYEELITHGRMLVAEWADGVVVAFVDTVPGEVTRLFILPEAAGQGLGSRLLELGMAKASEGHSGPIVVEATLNAEAFYRKHGFLAMGRRLSAHDIGGAQIEIIRMERPVGSG